MKKLLKAPIQDKTGQAFITNVIVGGRKSSSWQKSRELDFLGFIIIQTEETAFDHLSGSTRPSSMYKKIPMAWTEDGGSQSSREEFDLKFPIPRELVKQLMRRGVKSTEAAQQFSICRKEGYSIIEARTFMVAGNTGDDINTREFRFPRISGVPFPLHKIGNYVLLSDFLDPKQVALKNKIRASLKAKDQRQMEFDLFVERTTNA